MKEREHKKQASVVNSLLLNETQKTLVMNEKNSAQTKRANETNNQR